MFLDLIYKIWDSARETQLETSQGSADFQDDWEASEQPVFADAIWQAAAGAILDDICLVAQGDWNAAHTKGSGCAPAAGDLKIAIDTGRDGAAGLMPKKMMVPELRTIAGIGFREWAKQPLENYCLRVAGSPLFKAHSPLDREFPHNNQ